MAWCPLPGPPKARKSKETYNASELTAFKTLGKSMILMHMMFQRVRKTSASEASAALRHIYSSYALRNIQGA